MLREYQATLTRPQVYAEPPTTEIVIGSIQHYASFYHIAEDGLQVTEKLLQLVEQVSIGGKQIYDANIVATIQAYGIATLLTQNVDDFRRFSKLITVMPLESNNSANETKDEQTESHQEGDTE